MYPYIRSLNSAKTSPENSVLFPSPEIELTVKICFRVCLWQCRILILFECLITLFSLNFDVILCVYAEKSHEILVKGFVFRH